MAQLAKYIYCIIPCGDERTFDVASMGDKGREVRTINFDGLSVVASDSPEVRYESTRSNMLAHEKVLETVMQQFTLLPVRFGTVADSASPTESIQKLLSSRHQEFTQLLKDVEGKVELGLKAFWRDEKIIFNEILDQNPEIARMRNRLAGKRPEAVRFEGVELGRMVREALERKRSQEASMLLASLLPLAERTCENSTLADRMIFNFSFLIDRSLENDFDTAVDRLDSQHGTRVGLKYVGPTPPYNFVSIVVSWEDLESSGQR